MKQQTLAVSADQNAQYEQYRKPTRRDVFLTTMEQIVPWAALCEVIEPHYPKPGNGRPPVGRDDLIQPDCLTPARVASRRKRGATKRLLNSHPVVTCGGAQ